MPDQAGDHEEVQLDVRRWDLQTFTHLLRVVRQTRLKVTPTTFDSATSAERELMWGTIWDDKPSAVSQAQAGESGDVIDWQALFRDEAGRDMLEIRNGLKKKFVLSCDAVVASCSDIDKISRKDWEAWRLGWRNLHEDSEVAKIRDLEIALRPEDKALWARVRERARATGHQD